MSRAVEMPGTQAQPLVSSSGKDRMRIVSDTQAACPILAHLASVGSNLVNSILSGGTSEEFSNETALAEGALNSA